MNLYEIENGWCGESYERCYAWTNDEKEALKLAKMSFHKECHPDRREDGIANLKIRFLFEGKDKSLVSRWSDNGFDMFKEREENEQN